MEKIAIMKKLSILILLTLTTSTLLAQNTFPATGNVGIGIAVPLYNVDVSSGANTTLKIGSTVNTGYSDLIFKGSLNSWKISKSPSGTGTSSAPGTLSFTYNTNVYGGDRPVLQLNHTVSSWDAQFGTTDRNLFGGVNLAVYGSLGAQKLVVSGSTTGGSQPMLSVSHAYDGNIVDIKGVNYTTTSGANVLVGLDTRVTVNSGNVWGVLGLVNTSSTVTSSAVGVYGSVTSPNAEQFAGFFNGRVGTNSVYQSSDARLKDNIVDLNNGMLDKLNRINPKEYVFKNINGLNLPRGKQVGVLAQEINEIFPELVIQSLSPAELTGGTNADATKYLMVNYNGLIPYLIKGIQELSVKVEDQQREIDLLLSLTRNREQNNDEKIMPNPGEAALFQNHPNPFTIDTEIEMTLPETAIQASVIVYNLEGKELKSIQVLDRGNTSIRLLGNELNAGMYLYVLLVDGKVIATKRLILTK
jgi:hypothetical protein